MEGLLCLSKPAKDYAELEIGISPSENNNGDNGGDDGPAKASLSGKLSTTSMTSVGSVSTVSNADLKEFLEQMKWHINNKLDNTRIEMMELRKKVNSIDEQLKIVLSDRDGGGLHGNGDVDNGGVEAEEDKGGGDGEGGGSSPGNTKGGIRRGSGSLAKSIKGVFMNSNNNKMDKLTNGGSNSIKVEKVTNGEPTMEEEVEKRKTVTFGQDVVVKEFQRVFSGKRRSKKGQKVIVREEVPEEDEEEAEAERNRRKGDEMQKENGNADEDIDDFTDSEEETENKPGNQSSSRLQSPEIDLAKLREDSWRNSQLEGPNEYQNTTIGTEPVEDFYEIPVQDEPPALPPTLSRPPIKRVVDDNEDFYEDPDEQESGRGSMPPGSCSDEGSGNTFVFSHRGEKSDMHQIEDDFNSDSTDYEDVDDVDQEIEQREKQKKPKVDKLVEFKNEHQNEEDIDLIDRLLMLNNYFSTLKSVGNWVKRYCIAKDGQLFIYKSPKDKQAKAQRLPLMGYTVFLLGQQGKQDNVIKIEHHNLKPPLLLASESAETSNKWVAVLQRYSTINHTIVPGGSVDEEDMDDTLDRKKGGKLFSKEKKDGTPQLSMDGDVLSGYVNVLGAKFGEAKIRRKWITIKDMGLSCTASREDPTSFSFSIRGIEIAAADKKEVKMKGAFKLSKDGETYVYIEALNMLDAGHLLKKLVSASMNTAPKSSSGGRPASSSAEERGMVARLLASFETPSSDQTDLSQSKKGRRVQLQNQLNKRRASSISIQSNSSTVVEETYDDIMAPMPEEQYENSMVKSPPSDSSARRMKFKDKLKFSKSRQSTASVDDRDFGLYDDTVSPPPSGMPEELYDDVDVPPALPGKTTTQRKAMTLPSEERIPAVFEDLYLEVINDKEPEVTAPVSEASPAAEAVQGPISPQAPSTPQSRIKNFKLNFKVKKDKEKEVISPTESSVPGEKKETEKERKQREKKEKKEEKKKEKKDKKKKKDKETVDENRETEEVGPSTPTPPTPSTPPTTQSNPSTPTSTPSTLGVPEKKDEVKKPSPALQRKASAPLNKFKDSSMSHLLVKDKLMQDRKELETQQKELTTKRGDLRAKKTSSTDPVEKEKIQKEIDAIQKSLSEINKKLVQIAGEMEDATGDSKKDANANRMSGTTALTKKASVRAVSPDREKVSKGTVSDRMKMFQQGN